MENEQEKQNNIQNNILEAYDLSWNVDEDQTLLEKILSNASYVYMIKETDDDLLDQR